MINTYIPYLNFNEKKYILNCFKTNFISTAGPEVEKFEKEFCKKYDFKYAVALNSGTSALHLALLVNDIGINDMVVTPSYTFAATANAINYTGAKPYFFDCSKELFLDLNLLKEYFKKKNILRKNKLKRQSNKIKAIMPVLTMGQNIDFEKYEKFAKKNFMKIIFDSAACHDPGIIKKKKNSKSIFCFSFNGNKTLTCGSGGILATNSQLIAKKARILSTVGKKRGNYDYEIIGYNYKMTNLQASLGLAQLKNLDNILKKKKEIFDYYKKKIRKNENFEIIYNKKYVNWVFALILKKKKLFKTIKEIFNSKNIQLDFFWKPLHLQKPYKNFKKTNMRISENIWDRVLILPSHPNINKSEQDKICNIINSIK